MARTNFYLIETIRKTAEQLNQLLPVENFENIEVQIGIQKVQAERIAVELDFVVLLD